MGTGNLECDRKGNVTKNNLLGQTDRENKKNKGQLIYGGRRDSAKEAILLYCIHQRFTGKLSFFVFLPAFKDKELKCFF